MSNKMTDEQVLALIRETSVEINLMLLTLPFYTTPGLLLCSGTPTKLEKLTITVIGVLLVAAVASVSFLIMSIAFQLGGVYA